MSSGNQTKMTIGNRVMAIAASRKYNTKENRMNLAALGWNNIGAIELCMEFLVSILCELLHVEDYEITPFEEIRIQKPDIWDRLRDSVVDAALKLNSEFGDQFATATNFHESELIVEKDFAFLVSILISSSYKGYMREKNSDRKIVAELSDRQQNTKAGYSFIKLEKALLRALRTGNLDDLTNSLNITNRVIPTNPTKIFVAEEERRFQRNFKRLSRYVKSLCEFLETILIGHERQVFLVMQQKPSFARNNETLACETGLKKRQVINAKYRISKHIRSQFKLKYNNFDGYLLSPIGK
jgi:hypothetical protein